MKLILRKNILVVSVLDLSQTLLNHLHFYLQPCRGLLPEISGTKILCKKNYPFNKFLLIYVDIISNFWTVCLHLFIIFSRFCKSGRYSIKRVQAWEPNDVLNKTKIGKIGSLDAFHTLIWTRSRMSRRMLCLQLKPHYCTGLKEQ